MTDDELDARVEVLSDADVRGIANNDLDTFHLRHYRTERLRTRMAEEILRLRAALAVEQERCAVVAETYGVVGWLEYKDMWTVTIVHDTQRIVARAIREAKKT